MELKLVVRNTDEVDKSIQVLGCCANGSRVVGIPRYDLRQRIGPEGLYELLAVAADNPVRFAVRPERVGDAAPNRPSSAEECDLLHSQFSLLSAGRLCRWRLRRGLATLRGFWLAADNHNRELRNHCRRAPRAARIGARITPTAAMVTGISRNVFPCSSLTTIRWTFPSWTNSRILSTRSRPKNLNLFNEILEAHCFDYAGRLQYVPTLFPGRSTLTWEGAAQSGCAEYHAVGDSPIR